MRQELDDALCAKYPKLFVNRNKPMTETCMCWGFECPDSWYDLIDTLCHSIQSHLDFKNRNAETVEQVTVDQVKEKFKGLRFYYSGGDEFISGLVTLAENMSYKIK